MLYKDNIFSIEFAALNYIHPEKNKYSYILEGFNNNWLSVDNKLRKATFTNLDPGKYTFKVKVTNGESFKDEKIKDLKIIILPPYWRTKIAYIIYIIVIIAMLLLTRSMILARARMNFRIEQERQEARRRHELDMLKIKFFTNISHEFRSPLTLIITPLDKMIKSISDVDIKRQLILMQRNAKRLLNLINQLLDFRKMEVQEFKLNVSKGDIIKFIKEVSYSFSDLSDKKNIRFSFFSNVEEYETYFDHDKLEKILFNLLSNAFKFTHENGNVSVRISLSDSNNEESDTKNFEIRVKDSGIGISPEKQQKIFEHFFQDDLHDNFVNQGTGIGLAITKEFVRLHKGNIYVESEPEKGSCFIVELPLKKASLHEKEPHPIEEIIQVPEIVNQHETANELDFNDKSKKQVILLIDDNEDFRFYLKDNLKLHYHMIDASNAQDGWNLTLSNMPDLIVCDVIMPGMNGMEFCMKVKNDQRTSHIPLILLTASSSEEKKIEGFETGADDYITKPFYFELLESRIKNLIAQREKLQKIFHKQIEIKPTDITVTSLDEKLIQKALTIVEQNIANSNFSVEEMSREIGMSRVHLYKKLLSLTGKSPLEFIRLLRLKRAAQLLEKSQLSVSEIAYKVGFNNPKAFSKYFKEEFGLLPSVFAKERQKTEKQT